jgi:hypothetical protein
MALYHHDVNTSLVNCSIYCIGGMNVNFHVRNEGKLRKANVRTFRIDVFLKLKGLTRVTKMY